VIGLGGGRWLVCRADLRAGMTPCAPGDLSSAALWRLLDHQPLHGPLLDLMGRAGGTGSHGWRDVGTLSEGLDRLFERGQVIIAKVPEMFDAGVGGVSPLLAALTANVAAASVLSDDVSVVPVRLSPLPARAVSGSAADSVDPSPMGGIFPPSVYQGCLAKALPSAAAAGKPICEECQRH
jgi:hypothetical protein